MANNKTLEAIVSIAGQLDPSLQKSLAGAQKKFGGMKLGMAAVGTAAVAATAAVVKFGADSVKSAANFESKMANVSTLLDGTKQQVSQRITELGDDVLKVSNQTGVATSELSDGLYQIISAVGDSDDAITQMELAAKAAKAGNAETTDSINLLTAVTKGYNDTSGEAFQKASDLAFTTVKLGQTSFPELASSIGKVIPLASSLNVSQEELFGSFAALTGVTGSTAEVATQMKAVMSGLLSPSQGMTKALEQLGYANANAALDSLGLQGTLDALKTTVGGDTQQLAKMFSSVEAQTAILSLAGAQAEDFTSKTQAMYDSAGMTDQAFEAQTDTLEYTITCIKNLGQNFMTKIGRKVLPVVKSVAERVLPAVEQGLDNIEPVITSIYQGLSPVVDVIGNLVSGALPQLQSLLEMKDNTIFTAMQQAQPILANIAQQLFPIFQQVFGQVVGLFQQIAPVIAQFVANLMPAAASIISALIPIIQVLANAMSPIFSMIGQIVTALLPALTNVINFLVPIIQTLAAILTNTLSNAFSFMLPILQNITDAFTSLCNFISDVFTGNWSAAWTDVQSIFSNCFQALVGLAKAPINGVVAIINGVIQGINSMGFTIPDWVPVVGGKAFQLNIPEMPMFASGGFTNGPSIAGEAGREAVISFDQRYRNDNLSYWAKAGRMLGVNDSMLTSMVTGGRSSGTELNVTYAPQITVNGGGNAKEDIIAALRSNEEEFLDMLRDMLDGKDGDGYGFSY